MQSKDVIISAAGVAVAVIGGARNDMMIVVLGITTMILNMTIRIDTIDHRIEKLEEKFDLERRVSRLEASRRDS